jgi:hypothetical protein
MMSPIDIPDTLRLYISTLSLYCLPERLIGLLIFFAKLFLQIKPYFRQYAACRSRRNTFFLMVCIGLRWFRLWLFLYTILWHCRALCLHFEMIIGVCIATDSLLLAYQCTYGCPGLVSTFLSCPCWNVFYLRIHYRYDNVLFGVIPLLILSHGKVRYWCNRLPLKLLYLSFALTFFLPFFEPLKRPTCPAKRLARVGFISRTIIFSSHIC